MTATETTKAPVYFPPFDATAPKAEPQEIPAGNGYATGPIFMPRKLRFVNYDTSKSPTQNEAEYGRWKLVIEHDCSLGWGRHAKKGDAVEVDGTIASILVLQGQATWHPDESKVSDEIAAVARAKELGISPREYLKLDIHPPKAPKKTWMSGLRE